MNNIQDFADQRKEVYNYFIEFIDCTNEEKDEKYENLINILKTRKITENQYDLHDFLILINKVSKNHHRFPDFISRIEKILTFLSDQIKRLLSDFQIFNIFRCNKRILLFLFNENVININQDILDIIINSENKKFYYQFYFFNEIKEKVSPEYRQFLDKEISKNFPDMLENFQEKCKIGENESYLCSLIRNDEIEEFIAYLYKENITVSSTINPSIFETNYYLIDKTPSLIEYAAFYGSIEIFQYLRLNNATMDENLWFYSIHGRNPEIINFLEESKINVNKDNALRETIKCHHNELKEYFENTFYDINSYEKGKEDQYKPNPLVSLFFLIKSPKMNMNIINNKETNTIKKDIVKYGFKYHNYNCMPDDFNDAFLFKYFCQFNYISFCNLFLQNKVVKFNDNFEIFKFFDFYLILNIYYLSNLTIFNYFLLIIHHLA